MKNILISTNIGLRGTENMDDIDERHENVKKVLRKLHDHMAEIRAAYNANPILLAIQETGGYNFDLKPFFNDPIVTDNDIDPIYEQGHGKNGVATYCTANVSPQPFEAVDDFNEICTTTFQYSNKKRKEVKAAFINIYRNQHGIYNRSIEETIQAIKMTCDNLRQKAGIRKILIQGDFNYDGTLNLGPGFREITHPDMYHKHNDTTSKKFIDRLWVNFDDVGILEVRNTCENKTTGQNPELLGHKTIVSWIGQKPARATTKKVNTLNLNKLSSLLRGKKFDFNVNSDGDDCDHDTIDLMVKEFSESFEPILAKASSLKNFKCQAAGEKVLLNELEQAEQSIIYGKKQNKTLCTAMNNIRKGIADPQSTVKPSVKELSNKLEKKIAVLNKPDLDLGKKVIDSIFGNQQGICCERIKTLEQFRSIVFSVSNSGAKDSTGISLKVTKTLFQNNGLLRRLWSITECCLRAGYFPKDWKNDVISFIYKNKGKRSDPANWRPITISSSIGKHFEKIIGFLISGLDDQNEANNAYTGGRSCMTAIVSLQSKLMELKREGQAKLTRGKKLVCVVKADDISGAFESVVHNFLGYALELIFRLEHKYKIKETILSYLQKDSTVIDRDSTDSCSITKTFSDRSIPQGSLLSPLLWRLYDSIFSRLYTNCFVLVEHLFPDIVGICHISYADDHITAYFMIVNINDSDFLIGLLISETSDCLVEHFMLATEQMGCGINPLKSETIVPKRYVAFISLVNKTEKDPSNSFKWLGYWLYISDDLNLLFDEKKIKEHIKVIIRFRTLAYQYTNNIGIRWRTYQIFISPFVELYLPLAIQHPEMGITDLHMLQHSSMSAALRLPRTTGRDNLEIFLGERSIPEKAKRMANRVIKVLKIDRPVSNSGMKLRSGANTANYLPDKSNRVCFISRLFLYANISTRETEKVKFNVKKVKEWAHKTRMAIDKRINK